MNRRRFLAGSVALPLVARATAIAEPARFREEATHADFTAPVSVEPMMERYRLTRDRVLHGAGPAYTPDFLLEDIHATPGRRFTEFSGDVSGRWISSLAAASAAYGESFPTLDEVVRRTIALQHPEGYFGKTFHFNDSDDKDMALLWGNGRLLVGLMEYYALKQDPTVLNSAKRLGDFLLRISPRFNSKKMADEFSASHFASSYICWTQQTEGLAALYASTRDIRYRDLCAAISTRIVLRPADHVHGYLCSLRGTLDLYNATGDGAHLQRVEAAWQEVMHSGDVLITGGVPEAWSPKKMRTEGCAECDWLRLNLALWRATGNLMYLHTAEQVLFNEVAMNQFCTGDFGHARLNELGTPGMVYVRAWWCCTLHGLRVFPDIYRSVFRTANGQIFYDLPIDGRIKSTEISAHATSRLASDGTVHIYIDRISAGQTLTLRKPLWAHDLKVTVNSRAVSARSIADLKAGDVIIATYGMTLREDQAGESQNLAHRKAFYFGPWLLGTQSQANPEYFNELYPENILIQSSAETSREKSRLPYDVPIAAKTVAYIPAEFPDQPSRVQLRAVAEQTASLPMQWEMAFMVKNNS